MVLPLPLLFVDEDEAWQQRVSACSGKDAKASRLIVVMVITERVAVAME
jgi:hypothetical protein